MTLIVTRWWRLLKPCAVSLLIGILAAGRSSQASQTTFQPYTTDQGLASLGGACMIQDMAGYLLVCTEHGIFFYDGRHFSNLGAAQGLRVGGEVEDLVSNSTDRIAVRYADEVYISDKPLSSERSVVSLRFRPVLHPGIIFYDETPHQLVSWRGGFALLANDAVERVSIPASGPAVVEDMGYDPAERKFLRGAVALFSVAGRLWVTFDHGRICSADPGAVKCFFPAGPLKRETWVDVVGDLDGEGVLARSVSSVASFDPKLARWSVTNLPDQGGRYDNYVADLGLYRTPDGRLFTQSDHGLAVLMPSGWRVLTVTDGAPPGTIVGSMIDANGQFWFRVFGSGLLRWVGYGQWESIRRSDGLSEGIPWQTARSADGHIWVSTDTAVDAVTRTGMSLRVLESLKGSSFALAIGPDGKLWRGAKEGVKVYDPASRSEVTIDLPMVNAIASDSRGNVWIGTQEGLFDIDVSSGSPAVLALKTSARAQVGSVIPDGFGGAFYLANGHLRHLRSDSSDMTITGRWPTAGFQPRALAKGQDGSLWIGGSGGLYRFVLSGDVITRYVAIPSSDTRTNTIGAIMIDHRGWVWVGTALGVSVFDGQRWVSADADSGLVSDDVDEGGLREDPDGSVWITTTQGVSHLLDPASLFADRPIRAVVSNAELGDRLIDGTTLPYSHAALSLRFGTPNYGVERSVLFRYHLSGVDSGTAETPSGQVRYAFVPPGHHVLTVTAYDELTRRSSPPVIVVMDVDYPWWRQWWAEVLWGAGLLVFLAALMSLRVHAIEASREKLKRRVAEATEQLRYDRLTGLYIRSEVEERLAGKLAIGSARTETVVALIDVDHFKRVNDTYGHLGGDDVLRALGRLVLKDIWKGEYAGRYGGEEFLIVLDDADGRGAERVLQLLHTIRGTPFNAAGQSIMVTCSIGVAWAVPGDDWESLIGRADDALYEAKTSGRDQVAERRGGSVIVRGSANERRTSRNAVGFGP